MSALDLLDDPQRLLRGPLLHSLLAARGLRELRPGDALGAYRIVRELGRGGMGIVYLAARADGEYDEDVAIKWLAGGRLDPLQREQFRRERQILARLRHPHIACLLDGGHDEDGHLWFAMERVQGLPLDRHAAALDLDWRERVRLLLPVVDAVQFAHGRLLVHRDIKPGNVLVDDEGRARLLDFGVAALIADEAAQQAFTPGFASPEQRAGARPDVASDVWQLGRLLALTLEAAEPGRRAPRIPADLAAIVARACEAAPTRRYASAAALQADLERCLAYAPVAARPASPLHRVALLSQAHPLGSTASVLVLLAFLLLSGGFMVDLARQRDEAQRARAVAEAVNGFLNEGLLPGADPLQQGSNDASVSELLEHSLDQAEQRLGHWPEVAGEVEASLARALSNLGHGGRARLAFARARAHLAQARGAQHPSVLQLRLDEEAYRIVPAQFPASVARLRALRADALRALGERHRLVFDIDNRLARTAFLMDDFAGCEAQFRAVLARAQDVPADVESDTLAGLSECESRRGHFTRALAHAQAARALRIQIYGKAHPLTIETGLTLDSALTGLGRYDEAIVVLHDLHAALMHRYGETHPTTLTATHDLGLLMVCAGRPDEGVTWLRRAVEGRRASLGAHHPWLAISESVLAMALIRDAQLGEAREALQRAATILAEDGSANAYARAVLSENQADFALAEGRYADAVARFDEAIAAARPLYAPEHPRLRILDLGQGLALVGAGRRREGESALAAALAALGNRPDCRGNQVAEARAVLAAAQAPGLAETAR